MLGQIYTLNRQHGLLKIYAEIFDFYFILMDEMSTF